MCATGWFYLLFLVYPSCSSAIFSAFICDKLEDGTMMLRVDYSITCWEGQHIGIALYAMCMAILYPIGTPCLYAALIYVNHEGLERIKRAELVAEAEAMKREQRRRSFAESANVGASEGEESEARQRAREAREKLPAALQKLTSGYEMRCYAFEVFESLRKIALLGIPVELLPGSAAQLICGLLICFITAIMYSKYAPYVDPKDDLLAQLCQLSLFFSLAASIALKMDYDSSKDALGVLLILMLAVPPLVSFLFQNDLDFEGGLCLSKWVPIARRCFRTSIGRCLKRLLGPADDEARGAGVGLSVRSGKRGKLLPRDAVASSDVELTTGAPRTARASVGGVYVESEKMRV